MLSAGAPTNWEIESGIVGNDDHLVGRNVQYDN